MSNCCDIAIIGGGAAGFFAAVIAKQTNPNASVALLEKTGVLLSKVRISGGGRCNVTHACFDPKELVKNYPRGGKELLGPFHRFQPRDTIEWFAAHGVQLKTEDDGRMFPITDSSTTIIECLQREAVNAGVEIRLRQRIEKIDRAEGCFTLTLQNENIKCSKLLIATGNSPQGHDFAVKLGHTIQPAVPSLFTFNIAAFPLEDLAGISVEDAAVKLSAPNLFQRGPLLITHWGFSGPAALKLSAWAARFLSSVNYQTNLAIDWLPQMSSEELLQSLYRLRSQSPSQLLSKPAVSLPKKLWLRLLARAQLSAEKRLSEIGNDALAKLVKCLKDDNYLVSGKTTHKEEFVTCGGVTLSEVDFKKMESRCCSGLYFAGEILDIDAVTGGFNFQNAWTTGWLAGKAMVTS